jgi:3-oxoacyl-[acyl-carrier-protein] synthase II
VGNSVTESWKNILEGKHGFTLEDWYEGDNEPHINAKLKGFSPENHFTKKEARKSDPIAHYAVAAADEALKDAGSDLKHLDPFRVGIIIASGIGGLQTCFKEVVTYHTKGPNKVSVYTIPMMIGNMPAGIVAIRTGFMGVNYCPVSACASATHAIGEAFRAVKHGYIDAALAGGTEACAFGYPLAGFNTMHAITRSTNPDRASIPFDKERSGFVLGDGAGIVVMEELESAKSRGAKIYAEIAGYGATCDAYHETSPRPDGAGGAKAMEFAVKESGLPFTEVNYINAHGTSTPINDRTETAAIKTVFGDHAKNIAVNSTKSMTGHLLGAAGAVETIITALQIKNEIVHQTLGYKVPDEECDLDCVPGKNRNLTITAALSNSLGFGGHNACLCFRKYE